MARYVDFVFANGVCAFLLALFCMILLAACSGIQLEPSGPEVTGGVAVPSAVRSAADAPSVVVSPTGVVLPLISRSGSESMVKTPCGNTAALRWAQPLRDIDVVLDPGHGGSETGATNDTITEAAINLAVAKRTSELLNARGTPTALTRTGDYRVPIVSRVTIIDALEPRLFVSIHHNSSRVQASSSPGTEVYPQASSADSRRLAGLVYTAATDSLKKFERITWVSARNAGVISVVDDDGADAYGILRRPKTRGILVELAYLSNPAEAELIASNEYQNSISAALAGAISEFLSDPAVQGDAFVESERRFSGSHDSGGTVDCQDPELE